MGRRKRRRTRSDERSTRSYDRLDSWELIHSPYTVEGRIEGIARFAQGLRRSRGRKRLLGMGMWALIVVPFALGLIVWAVLFVIRL